MSMTPDQAFKLAFLQTCAESGMTMPEIEAAVADAVEKTAGLTDFLSKPYDAAFDAATSLGNTAKLVGGAGLLLGPPLAGAAAGYGAAKLTDIDDMDTEEAKKRELIDQYRLLAASALRNREARQRREGRPIRYARV